MDAGVEGVLPLWVTLIHRRDSTSLRQGAFFFDARTKIGDPSYREHFWTPLSLAIRYGDKDVVAAVLDKSDARMPNRPFTEGFWMPLAYAIDRGCCDVVQVLLDKKADPNHVFFEDTGNDWTPLGYAVHKARLDIVSSLLKARAYPDDTFGRAHATPMALAIKSGNLDLVSALIANGADKEGKWRGRRGEWTPLGYACFKEQGIIVDFLLCAGVDPEKTFTRDGRPYRPLEFARVKGNGNVLRTLSLKRENFTSTCVVLYGVLRRRYLVAGEHVPKDVCGLLVAYLCLSQNDRCWTQAPAASAQGSKNCSLQ